MQDISFEDIVKRLEKMELPRVDMVVGIGQGGTLPSSLVAYKLGCDFKTIRFNFRDEKNNPIHQEPQMIGSFDMPPSAKSILLVDDVSVSGKTLRSAKERLKGCQVKTLVLSGKADYVVFPEVKKCVNWPWKRVKDN